MEYALYVLLALSLTPLGRDLRQRMMARMYTRIQEKYEVYVGRDGRVSVAEGGGTRWGVSPRRRHRRGAK